MCEDALTPNTVELIPTIGALSPRGGHVQDPVLTGWVGTSLTKTANSEVGISMSASRMGRMLPFFFFTLGTGPRRSLSLKLSDTRVYEPQIRARLGTTAQPLL